MASNGRITMSPEGQDLIREVSTELDISDRPLVLRIAFAKGLLHVQGEPRDFGSGGWTIPAGVIARDDEYLLFKHLMINKLGRTIDEKEVDKYLLRFIEEGLRIMKSEIEEKSKFDNYLIQLVSNID
jgi:hypothetical protein